MKICSVCNEEKLEDAFEPKRKQCKLCRASKKKVSRAAWYIQNKQYAIRYSKKWRAENEEKRKAYRKQEYVLNSEKAKDAAKQYRKQNPHKVNAWSRQRQAARIKRTPIWVTNEERWLIEEAYDLARIRTKMFGFEWHVDHIIPLRGKRVSGLHAPNNLQVIPAKLNRVKSNSF